MHLATIWKLPWVGELNYNVIETGRTSAPLSQEWGREVRTNPLSVTPGQTLCQGTSGRHLIQPPITARELLLTLLNR